MSLVLESTHLPAISHIIDRLVLKWFEPVIPRNVALLHGKSPDDPRVARTRMEDLFELRPRPRNKPKK